MADTSRADAVQRAVDEATRVLCKANRVPDGDVIVREYRKDAEALAESGLLAVPAPVVDRTEMVARVNEALRSFLDWLDEEGESTHIRNRILFEVDHPDLWRRFLAATNALLGRAEMAVVAPVVAERDRLAAELVRAAQKRAATPKVVAEQIEEVTAFVFDETQPDFWSDLDDDARANWLRVFSSAFRRAGIPVDGENRG